MPAYLVTITYSGIVFGDDEKDALESAPDVFRASMFGPIHSEVVPLEQDSSPNVTNAPEVQP